MVIGKEWEGKLAGDRSRDGGMKGQMEAQLGVSDAMGTSG